MSSSSDSSDTSPNKTKFYNKVLQLRRLPRSAPRPIRPGQAQPRPRENPGGNREAQGAHHPVEGKNKAEPRQHRVRSGRSGARTVKKGVGEEAISRGHCWDGAKLHLERSAQLAVLLFEGAGPARWEFLFRSGGGKYKVGDRVEQ